MQFSPILILHISAGVLSLLTGAAALTFRKGSHWHGVAGNVFFVSMLTMSSAGVYMAFMTSEMTNVFGAVIVTFDAAAARSPAGTKNGLPAGIYFFLGSITLVSAAGDIRMLVRGGISGRQRLARPVDPDDLLAIPSPLQAPNHQPQVPRPESPPHSPSP